MTDERLMLTEEIGVFHNIGNRNHDYFIEGTITKKFEEIQKAVIARKLITVIDRRTGLRRYLDYVAAKWLPHN